VLCSVEGWGDLVNTARGGQYSGLASSVTVDKLRDPLKLVRVAHIRRFRTRDLLSRRQKDYKMT
jgi:hypothetical protein